MVSLRAELRDLFLLGFGVSANRRDSVEGSCRHQTAELSMISLILKIPTGSVPRIGIVSRGQPERGIDDSGTLSRGAPREKSGVLRVEV